MFAIDYQDRRPVFEQIVDRYELLIAGGVLAPHSQLPSVRQMAAQLSINPNTIQKAYSILEMNGYIYPVKGRGNFVTDNAAVLVKRRERYLSKLTELLREGVSLGVSEEACHEAVRNSYNGETH